MLTYKQKVLTDKDLFKKGIMDIHTYITNNYPSLSYWTSLSSG
jgi:hypothetical protein